MIRMSNVKLDKVREQKVRELEANLGFQVVALQPETELARLSKEQAVHLHFVEKELGVTLVAYNSPARLRLANPPEKYLKQLEKLEKQLGLVLVAYELNQPDERSQFLAAEQSAQPAELSAEKFKLLQKVESETGLTLMAYKLNNKDKKK